MDIFSVFTLCGGLAFFLYGMTTMSKSLEKMAGGKLERTLRKMTSSPIKSLLLGAGIAYYLIFVLIAWLFCQAVYFTVKLM